MFVVKLVAVVLAFAELFAADALAFAVDLTAFVFARFGLKFLLCSTCYPLRISAKPSLSSINAILHRHFYFNGEFISLG